MSVNTSNIPACNVIIFGAKGDLSRRKLLPSLYQLEKNGHLPKDINILGVGRATWNKSDYESITKEALTAFMQEKVDETVWQRFSQKINFHQLDVYDTSAFIELKKQLDNTKPSIFYFAMHPSTFGTICEGLAHANLNNKPNRIVMEKPIGTDLASSQEINNAVANYFDETQVYRIDHYLGKDTIINLFTLKFANPIFKHLLHKDYISHVQITVSEQVGIEGRWSYFDKAGQMRDMVQNHLLQILSIVAMKAPKELTDELIRQEKIAILKALKPITKKEIAQKTVRGQYVNGCINNKQVPGYLEEIGADLESNTETFVALEIDIDNDQWQGVPFYLRTGKRLAQKCSEVVIYFKNQNEHLYPDIKLSPNKIIIRLQPNEGVAIEILNNIPGITNANEIKPTKLNFDYKTTFNKPMVDAYERLFLEIMKGNQALFVHRQEVEAAWNFVDSIINAWTETNNRIITYPAGTFGPSESDELLERKGYNWNQSH